MSLFFQRLIYNTSLFIFKVGAWLAALFYTKARLLIAGRKNLFQHIASDMQAYNGAVAWFHCASLGEFEQGRPVMEAFKRDYPGTKILLTFFSPSGYEIRKEYQGADFIHYLPFDSATHAKRFIKLTRPKVVFFIKYEFWYHYLSQLQALGIPVFLVSAIFRKEQIFFKPYGHLYRTILGCFRHLFVQNQASQELLKGIGFESVSVSGDTRFDRVSAVSEQALRIPMVERFKATNPLMVIGSSWPQDMEVMIPFINRHVEMKFIVAPHEMDSAFFELMGREIERKVVRYSQVTDAISDAEVLLVDKIGLLSSLYRYGEYAFIGGAYGGGLHNILEAATFGLPVFFGHKNYQKVREAVDLISLGGAFPIKNTTEMEKVFELLANNPKHYQDAVNQCKDYISENVGATDAIMSFIQQDIYAGESI